MRNKLGLYPRYTALGASSRYRFYLYLPALQQAGLHPFIKPFFSNTYLRKLYQKKEKSRLLGALSLIKRLFDAYFIPAKAVIEYELLPQLPYRVEAFFLCNCRYVLNFDDNVWEKYIDNPKMADKYDHLIHSAAGVIVANDYLLAKVAALNANVIKIPTVVDLDAYGQCKLPKFERFTVVWIGTPVTYQYLVDFAETFRAMAAKTDFELLVIGGDAARPIDGVPMRFAEWSSATEAELLSRSHVGVMPLTDDAFSRGKSAFKLIQYAAAGIPAIASNVGENNLVIADGETGFLAGDTAGWVTALERLAAGDELYLQMAAAARVRSFEYSLQKYAPILIKFLKNI